MAIGQPDPQPEPYAAAVSVLCEAISVIVSRTALDTCYPGGVVGYELHCPNSTFCHDEWLTRVGFMHPDDVGAFVEALVRRTGLSFVEAGRFVDIAIVDQVSGPTRPCDWLDFSRKSGVTRAWLSGRDPGELATPPGWAPGRSLSLTTHEEASGLPIAPMGDGLLHTTIDATTGMTLYIGRTSDGPAGIASAHLTRLRQRRDLHDARGALEVCEAWVEEQPDSPLAWYELGRSATNTGRHGRAVTAFRRATELDSDIPEARISLGAALVDHGAAAEGSRVLESVVHDQPREALAWFHLGRAHLVLGELDPARAVLTRAAAVGRSTGREDVAAASEGLLRRLA
jgi:hypothetical protein